MVELAAAGGANRPVPTRHDAAAARPWRQSALHPRALPNPTWIDEANKNACGGDAGDDLLANALSAGSRPGVCSSAGRIVVATGRRFERCAGQLRSVCDLGRDYRVYLLAHAPAHG